MSHRNNAPQTGAASNEAAPDNKIQEPGPDWQAKLEEAKAASKHFVASSVGRNEYPVPMHKSSAETNPVGFARSVSRDLKPQDKGPIPMCSRPTSLRPPPGFYEPTLQKQSSRSTEGSKRPPIEVDLASSSDEAKEDDSLLGTLLNKTSPVVTKATAVPVKNVSPQLHNSAPVAADSLGGSNNGAASGGNTRKLHVTKPTPAWLPPGTIPRGAFACRTLDQLQDATRRLYISQRRRSTQKQTIRLLPLKFNEISVSTVAKWCAHNPSRTKNHNRPTVDTRYRKCSVCGLYGHYEVECPSLKEDGIIRFGANVLDCGEAESSSKKSFGLDDGSLYDVVTEICDGFSIEQRKAPEQKATNQNLQSNPTTSRTGESTTAGNEEVEIDGFTIRVAKSAEYLVGNKVGPKAENNVIQSKAIPLKTGAIVVWHPKAEDKEFLAVGRVLDLNVTDKKVLVRVMRSIAASNEPAESPRNDPLLPAEDSNIWISSQSVYVNVESGSDQGRPLRKRVSVDQAKPRSKRARMQHRYRMNARINEDDMSIRPARQTRQRPDGTYVAPAGRKPNGREWDSIRGLWVLADK